MRIEGRAMAAHKVKDPTPQTFFALSRFHCAEGKHQQHSWWHLHPSAGRIDGSLPPYIRK